MTFAPRIEDHLEMGIVFDAMYPDAFLDDETLLQTVDGVVHDPYFRRVEISGLVDPALRKAFRRRVGINRVKVSYLAQPLIFRERLDLDSPDRNARMEAVSRMMDCLDEAEDVGADMFELISGPNPEKDRHRAIDGFAESVHFLGEQAKKRNMVLLVEMFDFNVDKKRLIGSVEDTAELFERIDLEEDVRLLLDLSHIPMVNADIATAVHTLSPWIGHVHVGNTVMQPDDDRYGDSHPYFGYPAGSNDIDELAAFFLALHQIGYIRRERPSTVSFEIIRAPGERESDLVANAKRSLQLAWRTFTAKVGIADGQ